MTRMAVVCLLTALFLTYADGQQGPKQEPGAAPVFRSETRLVLLDVVVTDAAGHPIHSLKRPDFTIFEDGKRQEIVSIEEHAAGNPASKAEPKIILPEHEYTNYISADQPGAHTVVLVDSVNSSREDLTNAKQQLLRLLKKMPSGNQIALYALGDRLTLLQNFTTDSAQLEAAAANLSTHPLPIYMNNREVSAMIGEMKESGLAKNPKAFRAAMEVLGQETESKDEMRRQDALDGLAQLARALAVVPGRKNLIWLSGGFPFDSGDFERFRRVATLLAATRIAVFPIDVRRIVLTSADAQTRDTELYAPVQTQSYETIAALSEENRALEDSMQGLAHLTGGRAYLNKNDLDRSIRDAVENGTNYYSIAYHPSNAEWSGKFRRVAVKASPRAAKVLCRAGYYAVTDPLKTSDPDAEASIAMDRGVPLSTQLIVKARVVPPQSAGTPVSVDMLVDAHAVSFNKGDDGRETADLQFIAVATNAEGKPAGSFSEFFRQPVTRAQLDSLLKTGVQLHREMQLPAGSYLLRLGVMDRLANRIGTLDVLLAIPPSASR